MRFNLSAAAQGEAVAASRIVLAASLACACLGAIASTHGGLSILAQPEVLASAAAAAGAPPLPALPAPVPAHMIVPVTSFMPPQTQAVAPTKAVFPPLPPNGPMANRSAEIAEAAGTNDALKVPEASDWKVVHVRPRQHLGDVFRSLGLTRDDALAMERAGRDARRLEHLHANDVIRVRPGGDHVNELTYAFDETHTLDVRRVGSRYESNILTAELEHRARTITIIVDDSLDADGHRAGLNDRQIADFANLFNYDVDFGQDLQDGDRIVVVVDELFTKAGKLVRSGDILAAEYDSGGDSYRAVRFVNADGVAAYYTPDGQALRKSFIRTPVDYTHISSGFSLHRWHPILHRMRAHKGVDYAAPRGTPVHASGDGRVEFAGRKGGYGNVVILQHGGHYETVYGHLSRFARGLRSGAPVHQGQVIAYVGMTGLATAPHLHYEFRVDGIPRNPVTVKLPRANPLTAREMTQFRAESKVMVARMGSPRGRQYADASRP